MATLQLKRIVERQRTRETQRKKLQQQASVALSASKRAIFALHRDDAHGAKKELETALKSFRAGLAICKTDSVLQSEGMWRAALEEYSEAAIFYQYLTTGEIGIFDMPSDDPETLIGGLADFTGELTRYAVLKATNGDREAVDHLYAASNRVIGILLGMDLTGSLRTKFDQAKQHLRKLEEIRYDLSRHV